VLGELSSSSVSLTGVVLTLVSMNGTLGLVRKLARWTMVDVPVVPFSFTSRAAIRSESFAEMPLVRDSPEPGREPVALASLWLPSS